MVDQWPDGKVKPIALVLPQYHPIPENNQWWGEGFTEWTNVVKGRPRFPGHYQPHLPKDLGFYDLRLPDTREAQANLARQYGIYGFCYYHYWFEGRRLLEKPVDEILATGQPDFPFMLCWANENWSRNWDGGFDKILVAQNYSEEDFILQARYLVKFFNDHRYIKIKGRPVFAIYKDGDISHLESCVNAFRAELQRHGIDVFLCRFERAIGTSENFDKAYAIFDAGIEFQPLTRQFRRLNKQYRSPYAKFLDWRRACRWIRNQLNMPTKPVDRIIDYADVVNNDLAADFQQGWPIFPGVSPGWDNSARRPCSSALILDGSRPELFAKWVAGKIQRTSWDLLPERFLFVNAWNEWAEGNHLEPCEQWGCRYLSALQEGLSGGCSAGDFEAGVPERR
jgi:hypothetical protein